MGYYPAVKRSEVLTQAIMCFNLENMLTERSQSQKTTYCMIPCI